MIEELEDAPDLQEDARLIRDQADRCRDILHSMGQAGKDDLHIRQAPIGAVVQEAAAPHLNRGKAIEFDVGGHFADDTRQPIIDRRPEIIHGLRNLVQNAVDFAKATVWVDVAWDDEFLWVKIVDDGPGFPSYILSRIGDPFVGNRKRGDGRPGYEGMGLGLFIAKTMLERTGAELTFTNTSEPGDKPPEADERAGALVEARWRIDAFSEALQAERAALGENRHIKA